MNDIVIRPATTTDAEAIARLATQLSYAVTESDVSRRLVDLAQRTDHEVFVAAAPEKEAVGWIHLYVDHIIFLTSNF